MIASPRLIRTFLRWLMGASCALVVAGCPLLTAQTLVAIGKPSEVVSTARPPAAYFPTLPDYIISPDDVLLISVYDAPDITGEYRVSPTGQIELPLLSAPIVPHRCCWPHACPAF
jgi:hypothetical protein